MIFLRSAVLFVLVSLIAQAPADELMPIADMVVPRWGHSATRLPDGRVLLAGGATLNTSTQQSSAEIYDPATGTFSLTGSMHLPRWGHGAALLDDGRVLVLGGWVSGFTVATAAAEVYDPVSGQFTFTGSMSTPRADVPPVIKLDDGKVAVIGGTFEGSLGTATANIDIYDPDAGTFTHAASLGLSRRDHAATRLSDGTVLVAGGVLNCCNDVQNGLRNLSAETFDPAVNVSTATAGEMSHSRARLPSAVTLGDGRALVAGGGVAADLYDPATRTFTEAGDPAVVYFGSAYGLVLLADGRVLVSGNGVNTFNPADDTFTGVATDFSRNNHTATRLLDGTVLLAGGGQGFPALRTASLFVPGPLAVDIDIKPDSLPNSINAGSRGRIPVAVLSSPTFDAPSRLDLGSLTFGRVGDEASLSSCNSSPEDVNLDGLPDQLCHFATQRTGFQAGDTTGVLMGRMLDEVLFRGTDSVRIVPR